MKYDAAWLTALVQRIRTFRRPSQMIIGTMRETKPTGYIGGMTDRAYDDLVERGEQQWWAPEDEQELKRKVRRLR